MLTRRLPATVEPYRLAANHENLEGLVALDKLARLRDEIGEQQGDATVTLQFEVDAQRRHLIDGELSATLFVPCRRCLQPMLVEVESRFQLGIVSDDALAAHLPADYEPVLVNNEQLDLLEAVEDELILSLPQVVYHDEADCAVSREQLSSGDADFETASRPDSPFDVLKALKGKSESE
ncbi:YceD family protein [Salinicola avicenniae]|uniref:YceD family protein n=1 Tax=Salinicola avicenniae TaxID=2916836 RepID=UPI0020734302|nr:MULTISPECIES: YceD family protein [unclassified Salinicola]